MSAGRRIGGGHAKANRLRGRGEELSIRTPELQRLPRRDVSCVDIADALLLIGCVTWRGAHSCSEGIRRAD